MASDLLAMFDRMLSPLRVRVANMVSRAIVTLVDDSQQMQIVQLGILGDETRAGLERFQNYGFTGVPMDDGKAEAAVVFVGGRRDHGLVIAVDDRRYRLTGLQKGEVAVYNKFGAKVLLKADGSIEVNGGTTPVAKEGSSTTGHTHTLTGTAGPYPLSGSALTSTDSIASGAGSSTVKVP